MDANEFVNAITVAEHVGKLRGEVKALKTQIDWLEDRNDTLQERVTDLKLSNQKYTQKIRELSAQLRLKP